MKDAIPESLILLQKELIQIEDIFLLRRNE